MCRAFELCKDAYFFKYMGRKQEAHEEDESPIPSLTVDKLLKFALDKYTDQSHINNHVCGLLSKREAEFIALADEVTTMKGNLNIADKIAKKKNLNRGVEGASPKSREGNKLDSNK